MGGVVGVVVNGGNGVQGGNGDVAVSSVCMRVYSSL